MTPDAAEELQASVVFRLQAARTGLDKLTQSIAYRLGDMSDEISDTILRAAAGDGDQAEALALLDERRGLTELRGELEAARERLSVLTHRANRLSQQADRARRTGHGDVTPNLPDWLMED